MPTLTGLGVGRAGASGYRGSPRGVAADEGRSRGGRRVPRTPRPPSLRRSPSCSSKLAILLLHPATTQHRLAPTISAFELCPALKFICMQMNSLIGSHRAPNRLSLSPLALPRLVSCREPSLSLPSQRSTRHRLLRSASLLCSNPGRIPPAGIASDDLVLHCTAEGVLAQPVVHMI